MRTVAEALKGFSATLQWFERDSLNTLNQNLRLFALKGKHKSTAISVSGGNA
jgi:hypothetical protein